MTACDKQTSRIAEEHVVHAAGQLGQEIPKGKIKGDREDGEPVRSRRPLVIAAALVLIVLAAALVALAGNPLQWFDAGPSPSPPRVGLEQRGLPAGVTPVPAPPGMPVAAPPPPMPGSFSVLIGTYDSARPVALVERALALRQVPVYMIDVPMAPGDVQRRVLVGRYATREEAEQVRATLGPAMSQARVIASAQERLRVIP